MEKVYNEVPFDIVDEVVLVDDQSTDATVNVAKKLKIKNVIRHSKNRGYGGNQKTCYDKAIELKADIIVLWSCCMMHAKSLTKSSFLIILKRVKILKCLHTSSR